MSQIRVNTIQNANGTTGITFAANGQVTLANTPLQLTGGQIQFPATQIASADPNTLDDYEEGTWTPTFTISSGSITYANQTGNYVKIGRQVTVTFYVNISTATSAISSSGVGGLPFAGANTNYGGAAFAYFGAGLFNSYGNMQGLMAASTTELQLRGTNNGAVAPALVFAGATLTNGTALAGTLTYFTN